MKILNLIFSVLFALTVNCAYSDTNEDTKDTINTFAEIYEKLDSVQWGGKNIEVVIESLEHLSPKAHLAATDDRIILVWQDSIVGNFAKPVAGDWQSYGKITTSLISKMRERDAFLASLTQEETYERAFSALMQGIDETGKYIPKQTLLGGSNRVLTSLGVSGWRDRGGEFRVSAVVQGSPADIAGVQVHDLIDKVNGRSVAKMSDAEMELVFQGLNSGTAKLHLLTPNGNRDVVLRRATIVMADADIIYRPIDKDNGLLEIVVHEITDGAVNIINEALRKYNNAFAVILDLRAASGVDARAATKLAGLFIGQKPIMRMTQTAGEDVEYVPGGQAITDARLAVLVSNTTTGTAEAIASAVYENRRGVLVGTPTAGNARIATHIDLSNGGALEILNQSIKSGAGIALDKRGIFPIVCLSNIRSIKQQNAFFINVINDDFNIQDFNKDSSVDVDALHRGCPIITNGDDEDMVSAAIATKILTDETIYNKLIVE